MIKKNSNNKVSGTGNTQHNGDTIINIGYPLSQTVMYSLLEIVRDSVVNPEDDYSLSDPKEFSDKLVYNNAPRYKEIFMEYADSFGRLEEVIEEFENSEQIVKKIRRLYLEVADYNEHHEMIVGNGDIQLKNIEQTLIQIIKCDKRFWESNMTDEVIEEFVLSLLSYTVFKCKVLVVPS